MTYCPHFHIDCGETQCWAVVDNIGKHGMSIEQIQQYTRLHCARAMREFANLRNSE